MFRAAINRRLICAAFLPFTSSSEKDPSTLERKILKFKIMKHQFHDVLFNKEGYPTKEFQSVINTTVAGSLAGFVFGGFLRAKDVPEKFKAENQATLYKHKFYAHKELQNRLIMSALKGGLKLGSKVGLFCFLFSGTATALYLYRGCFDVINHTIAGGLTGFLFKMSLGWKGAFSGSVVGSSFGTLYGALAVFLLYITDTEVETLFTVGNKLMEIRQEKLREHIKETMAQEESDIKKTYLQTQKIKEAQLQKEQKEPIVSER